MLMSPELWQVWVGGTGWWGLWNSRGQQLELGSGKQLMDILGSGGIQNLGLKRARL